MKSKPAAFASLALLFGAFTSFGAVAKPNIVVILADDMGYGDPGCFNPKSKIATPNIDRLARDGMRFTDAHAPGALCHPSRYGLLTGQYPSRTDTNVWPGRPVIKDGQMTIASLLRGQGYRTAMVGKWHLGFQEGGYDKPLPGGPIDRGFHSFYGFRASTDIPPYFFVRGNRAVAPPTKPIAANNTTGWSPIQGAFWREGLIAPDLELKDVLPRLTDEAVAVIQNHTREAAGAPLMLYFALTGPHTPWLPADEFVGRSKAGMYGDFAMMVDAMIGRVLKTLDDTKLSANTLVIFTSDNGPVWYPEDVKRLGHDATGGLRGMKADAWEGGHRMPFIVRWPGKVNAGTSSRQLVCFTDLMATFADVVDTPLPNDAGPDSYSFLPVLLGRPAGNRAMRDSLIVKTGLPMIRSGPWKLIAGLGSGGFSKPARVTPGPGEPEGQLYNLDDDIGETKNLYADKPEIVARLKQQLAALEHAGRSRP
ncbi:MAG: arylsulfatase [Opitutaceae bacterium]|nr:arylsulfatase [Opitutaceae bacterium]